MLKVAEDYHCVPFICVHSRFVRRLERLAVPQNHPVHLSTCPSINNRSNPLRSSYDQYKSISTSGRIQPHPCLRHFGDFTPRTWRCLRFADPRTRRRRRHREDERNRCRCSGRCCRIFSASISHPRNFRSNCLFLTFCTSR